MTIDTALLHKLGQLARLNIQPEQEEALRQDLEKMIDFVARLNHLDTTGVEPLLHLTSARNVLRPDEAAPPIDPKQAVAPAKRQLNPYFAVPKVIQK